MCSCCDAIPDSNSNGYQENSVCLAKSIEAFAIQSWLISDSRLLLFMMAEHQASYMNCIHVLSSYS